MFIEHKFDIDGAIDILIKSNKLRSLTTNMNHFISKESKESKELKDIYLVTLNKICKIESLQNIQIYCCNELSKLLKDFVQLNFLNFIPKNTKNIHSDNPLKLESLSTWTLFIFQ